MVSELYIPSYPLNQFIESFFYYTDFNPQHSVDRFLPDGNVQIVFDLTDYPKCIYDNQTLKEIQSCRNAWFSGFRLEPISIPSGRESEMLIVTFRKGRAFPFLSEPLHILTNQVVDADLVLKNQVLYLREQLRDCKTAAQKFLCLETNLIKYFLPQLRPNPLVEYVISRLLADPTQYRLKDISEQVGYSQKHFIKIFKDHVGVTAKNFLKVVRFQRAIEEIEQQKCINWAFIAFDCGFYDQSHFIADFKNFSGYTPTEYLKKKGEMLNYVPVK